MRRIQFALCAVVVMGLAAQSSAQASIRDRIRSRHQDVNSQYMPSPGYAAPGTVVMPGTTAMPGTVVNATPGTVILSGTTATSGTTFTPPKTTANYAPAGAESDPVVTTPPVTVMNMPQTTTMHTVRRGLFGRRSYQEPVMAAPMTGQMSMPMMSPTPGLAPMPSPKPANITIPSTTVPGGSPSSPLPTKID